MKSWKFLPLVLSASLLTGCDGTAIEFVRQTRALLDEYEKKIHEEIAQSEKYYGRDADIAARAGWRQLNDSLGVEREERSSELAADYLEGRKPVSLYRSHIRGYSQTEYDTRKSSLQAGVDAALPYLEQLAKLEAGKETIEALGKALDALQEKRTLKDHGDDLQNFVTETKTDFNRLVCADLKTQKAALDQKAATETGDQQAADQAQSDAISTLRTDRKCDDAEKDGGKP